MTMDEIKDPIYREFLLDHYKNPRNKSIMKNPDIRRLDNNPTCGDMIEVFVKLDKNMVKDISFQGNGCVISMASASILMEELKGKSLDDIKKMSTDDTLKLLNLKLTPTRVKCAMLALSAIKKGMMDYEVMKGRAL